MRQTVLAVGAVLQCLLSSALAQQPASSDDPTRAASLTPPPPAAAEVRTLSIAGYPGFSVEPGTLAVLVTDINGILRASSFADTACSDLTYRISGGLETYDGRLPKVVTSLDQIRQFQTSPYDIHVVRSIHYCPGAGSMARIYGCAFRGGPVLIANTTSRSLLYLHELGHRHALAHIDDQRNFMHAAVRRKYKQPFQCDALYGRVFLTQGGRGLGTDKEAAPPAAEPQPPLTLEEELTALWPHGFPVDLALKYTDDQLGQIRRWLGEDPADTWANAISVLGLRGNRADLELMQRVLDVKRDDEDVVAAKLTVPRAAAMIIYKHGGARSLDQAERWLNPRRNEIYFTGPADRVREQAEQFATEATLGMAIIAARRDASTSAKRSLSTQRSS